MQETLVLGERDVCHYAKIRILKQITTGKSITLNRDEMFVTMQR